MTGVLSMFLFKGYLNCYRKDEIKYKNIKKHVDKSK